MHPSLGWPGDDLSADPLKATTRLGFGPAMKFGTRQT
jgi:hypothetical protein